MPAVPPSSEHELFQYRLLRRIGAGGMGEVFLAHDTKLERDVALKILSAELAADENNRRRFHDEARSAAALVHPSICVILEVSETPDGRPFLAMEYVEGKTLDRILKERRLRIGEALRLGQEVAEALDAAHRQGLIHRDIKSSNIMLDARGHAKVLDFGLAKRLGREQSLADTKQAAQTQTGALVGTPYYMSPEQALGREVDARSDIFSLGAVLYELVTGQRPFTGETIGEILNNLINREPEPLGLDNPLLSPALDQLIFKCLEKAPEKRYASAADLAHDLAALRSEVEHASTVHAGGYPRARLPSGRRLAIGIGVLVCAALLGLAGYNLFRARLLTRQPHAAGPGIQQKSVAVLPFDNFTGEADTEYLSDGLTEEITGMLSRIQGLKVAARNSAFMFRGRNADTRLIGQTLKVSSILTGSIRKAGARLRVSAQLANAADGFLLWSESYERSMDDIIAVQEDIARRIADRLQAGADLARSNRRSPSADAHRLYLQARHFWNQRTELGLTNAIQQFEAALKKDPLYPDAFAGLAATYVLLPNYAAVRRTQYFPLARAAAQRALELDPSCAEAHCVFAQLEWAARNLKAAEDHFKRALQFAPNYATAHHWYGQFLTIHGRADEGLAQLRAAVDLDPLSRIIRTTIPEWYFMTGDWDHAVQEARDLISIFADFPPARLMLSYALLQKGAFAEALSELERARTLAPGNPLLYMDFTAYALARSGQEPQAREILARYERLRAEGKSVDSSLALIYVGLREYDQAIDALERVAATDILEDNILCDPFFKEVLPLPRFQTLLQKAGLR